MARARLGGRDVVDKVAFTAAGLYAIVLLRAGGTFAVGWLAGAGARRGRLAERISTAKFRRAERAIQRWGAPVVAVSFLTVGFQTAANFLAGSMRMPLSRYLPALFVGERAGRWSTRRPASARWNCWQGCLPGRR